MKMFRVYIIQEVYQHQKGIMGKLVDELLHYHIAIICLFSLARSFQN